MVVSKMVPMRWVTLVLCLAAATAVAQQPPPSRPGPQRPTRDTSSQQGPTVEPPPPAGRIIGRVLAADTGRPIKRARVLATAAELPEGRGALTDDQGVYELPELPAGRYTVNASKSGFVGLSFGQRRPRSCRCPSGPVAGPQ